MKLTVDILRDFIAGLDFTSKILSFTTTATTTILVVENVFHIRANPIDFIRQVDVDGTSYDVSTVDYNVNTVTINAVLTSALIYTVANPFYFHGTPISTSNEIKNLSNDEKLPFVFLWELLQEKFKSPSSDVDRVSDVRLVLADVANFSDWTRKEHYQEAITPLSNLFEVIKKELYKGGCVSVDEEDDITVINNPKWGVNIDTKGNKSKIFNDNLDAIGMRMQVKICIC